MSHRSNSFSKLKQALTQDPAPRPASTWSPVPLDGDPRRPVRNFTNPRQLPGLEHMTASDGLTVVMPAARPAPTQILPPIQAAQDAANLSATQILPAPPLAPAPSARHVDPAKRTTTFVEDNDLEPHSRGQHVLAELSAGPDIATELMAVQNHIHNIFDPMRRAEVAARANDEQMRAFSAQWDARQDRAEREFESWAARFKKALAETRANWAATSGQTNADRLAMAYEAGGTSAALYTKDQLAQEIARHEATSSAVAA